ncbi:helix-turn-helix transcriptional regulator [Sphingobacterium siyangense]|uniref:helix-turn-helix transcriptional regulator n=2 Tax=Sphingobacterium TaxID=28453 RepID=UPI0028A22D3B|nr:AraC family transcriptional regulator [Sphingobacterium siyangense]
MIKNKMKNCITIRLLGPADNSRQIMEITLPVRGSDRDELVYSKKEFKTDQSKLSLRRWVMPGLCIIEEESLIVSQFDIDKPYISIVCQQGVVRISNKLTTQAQQLMTLKTRVPRCTVLFSVDLFTNLFGKETWINKDNFFEKLVSAPIIVFEYFLEPNIKNIIDTLLNEHTDDPFKRYYFELKIKELLYLLLLQPPLNFSDSTIPNEVEQKLAIAKAYLLTSYQLSPTIKQLSRLVLLNEFKLKYFFKLKFGTTIKSYIIHLRMIEAKALVCNGCSVNDIAARLGYKNVSHFILIFKRTFDVTPKEMAKKN